MKCILEGHRKMSPRAKELNDQVPSPPLLYEGPALGRMGAVFGDPDE